MKEQGTWLHWLYTTHILPHWIPEAVPVTWFVIIILSLTAILASRKLKTKNPGRFQMFLEFTVTALDNFVKGIVGEENAKTLTPIIGATFIFILVLNLWGLIPGFMSPTANINTTVALALSAFLLVQYLGFRKMGFKYLMHFVGEPIWLAPLMLPIHVIGELARPLSLSIRLFGNIFGEDMVIAVILTIVMTYFGKALLPLQFPMVLFAVFTSLVQALVFSMLVCIYIAVAVAGHEEH